MLRTLASRLKRKHLKYLVVGPAGERRGVDLITCPAHFAPPYRHWHVRPVHRETRGICFFNLERCTTLVPFSFHFPLSGRRKIPTIFVSRILVEEERIQGEGAGELVGEAMVRGGWEMVERRWEGRMRRGRTVEEKTNTVGDGAREGAPRWWPPASIDQPRTTTTQVRHHSTLGSGDWVGKGREGELRVSYDH